MSEVRALDDTFRKLYSIISTSEMNKQHKHETSIHLLVSTCIKQCRFPIPTFFSCDNNLVRNKHINAGVIPGVPSNKMVPEILNFSIIVLIAQATATPDIAMRL